MSEAHPRTPADWLGLAAAPAFAAMALVTAGGGQMATICAAAPAAPGLGGMTPMYLLMGAVHLGPWLRLMAARSSPRAKAD